MCPSTMWCVLRKIFPLYPCKMYKLNRIRAIILFERYCRNISAGSTIYLLNIVFNIECVFRFNYLLNTQGERIQDIGSLAQLIISYTYFKRNYVVRISKEKISDSWFHKDDFVNSENYRHMKVINSSMVFCLSGIFPHFTDLMLFTFISIV